MTSLTVLEWLLLPSAYLLGSISTAIIVCHVMGLPDPRSQGSNNPGATNVLRIGGKKAATITLLGDALKGVIPVLAGHALQVSDVGLAAIGFLAFIGHLFPIFFQFRGGKGVATAFGVLATISWPTGFCLLISWLVIAKVFKISSLAALLTACLAPFCIWYWEQSVPLLVLSVIISLLLIWRHQGNIRKLLSGAEDKIR